VGQDRALDLVREQAGSVQEFMTAKGSRLEILEGGWSSLRFVLLETLLPLVLKVPRRLCMKAHDWSSSSACLRMLL